MALREIPGISSVREMKYARGINNLSDEYPILSGMLQVNMVLSNLFLHRFIEVHVQYIYHGLNFLRNKHFVLEQFFHRDFFDPNMQKPSHFEELDNQPGCTDHHNGTSGS